MIKLDIGLHQRFKSVIFFSYKEAKFRTLSVEIFSIFSKAMLTISRDKSGEKRNN